MTFPLTKDFNEINSVENLSFKNYKFLTEVDTRHNSEQRVRRKVGKVLVTASILSPITKFFVGNNDPQIVHESAIWSFNESGLTSSLWCLVVSNSKFNYRVTRN
jgi:hypothetical protein